MLIFSGQSNMQGQTESMPVIPSVEGALEYRILDDSLIPLNHPAGEDIGDELFAAAAGGGSLIPAFSHAYVTASGKETVAVHAARGSTCVHEWLKNTPEGEKRYAILIR